MIRYTMGNLIQIVHQVTPNSFIEAIIDFVPANQNINEHFLALIKEAEYETSMED